MAHIVENMSNSAQGGVLAGMFASLRDAIARRRVYKRTYMELSQLSTRELDDLGIARSMITRLAYEAAYEN